MWIAFDFTCVPVRVSINKLIVPNRIAAGLVSVFRNVGGLATGESYIPAVPFDSLLHRSRCFPNVGFAAHEGNPVVHALLSSRMKDALWSHQVSDRSVVSDTVRMPCCSREGQRSSDTRCIYIR